MPYNFVPLTIFTQRNFVADFLQAKCEFRGKTAVLHFWAPFGGLRGNVRWSSWARWKARRGLPISVNWTFFSLGRTTEALRAIIGSKFQIEGVAPTHHYSSQKTRLNDLLHGIKSGYIFLPFCHNARVCQTDRQTDRQTEISSPDRVCIPCSAVIMHK